VQKSSAHLDPISVVLDEFLNDAFRRLAAKSQLSHCTKRFDTTHNNSQHTVNASRANNNLKLQARQIS
jgi:hypothetical protein